MYSVEVSNPPLLKHVRRHYTLVRSDTQMIQGFGFNVAKKEKRVAFGPQLYTCYATATS